LQEGFFAEIFEPKINCRSVGEFLISGLCGKIQEKRRLFVREKNGVYAFV
jgi:hypothetical protein